MIALHGMNAAPAPLPSGARLKGFELLGPVGRRGGFGITYRAVESASGRLVAIKEYLPAEFSQRTEAGPVKPRTEEDRQTFNWGLKYFLYEARTLARFTHPNLVRLLGLFPENGTAYMAMEFIDGESLADLLRRAGKVDEAAALRILLALLSAVELVHGAGILHRDINPSNIMLRKDGSPVLIDFGSARSELASRIQATSGEMTLAVATTGYAPMEQYGPKDRQGPWTDVYAIAAVGYRMLSGEKPPDALFRQNRDPVSAAQLAAVGVKSAGLCEAIVWGMRPLARERPQSAGEFRQALAKLG